MKISSLIEGISESATVKTFQMAKELERQGVKVINLGVGEPDFDTPEPIKKAAYDAIASGYTHYTPSRGLPELREAIAEKLVKENCIEATPENIIVTPGSKQTIYEAVLTLVDDGDEVLIPTPAWVSYMDIVKLARGVIKEVRTEKTDFKITPEALEKNIGNKTKLLILNSPNNPTGVAYTEKEIKNLAEVIMDHSIYVLSDEIYEKIIYEKAHLSIGSVPGMENLTITVNGFSKAYAMTGWRLGYATGPKEIISAMDKIQQHTAVCAPSFVQRAGIVALQEQTWEKYGKEMVREFKKRRDFLVKELPSLELPVKEASGAFYLFPDISRMNMTSTKFSEFLLKSAGAIVTPGSAFGGYDNNVRISYATSLESLKEAMKRIKEALEGLVKQNF